MDNTTSLEQTQHIRGVIESILFVNEKPVTLEQLKKLIETVSSSEIKQIVDEMIRDYETRQSGMRIIEIAGGYQMLSNGTYATYIREFYKTKHTERLSKPALETLAIIAYKQPVTRSDIEQIRGVNSDGVVTHLLEKELIKAVGRKDVPGKPFLYGTTKQFLEYFGLKSLQDLPRLEEFPKLVPVQEGVAMIPLEQGEENKAATETAHPKESSLDVMDSSESSSSSQEEPVLQTQESTATHESRKST